MRPEDYDFLGNLSGTWSIFVGAILATAGGFFATQMERHLEEKRRERNAALLFAEVISMMGIILELAHETYGRGEPFGPITLRMLRSARKEIDIYDRNREGLFDIRDAALRARVHSMMLRLAMPMDGIFDMTQEIAAETTILKSSPDLPEAPRREIEAHIADLIDRRQSSYEYIRDTLTELKVLIAALEPIAQQSFERHELVARNRSALPTNASASTTP